MPVAIAAASEDDNEFTRPKSRKRFQNIEQRVVGVRVINKDLELPFRRHSFESPGHLRRSSKTENRFAQINAQRVRRRERSHGIRDVESADQRHPHEITLSARIELVGSAGEFRAIIRGAKICPCPHPICDDWTFFRDDQTNFPP